MNKEELLAEIDAVCMMLYQNNEHVAIGRISELLNIFQDMIQRMADCLMEKAVLFVSFYYGEE